MSRLSCGHEEGDDVYGIIRVCASETLAVMERFLNGKVALFGENLKVKGTDGCVHVCESVLTFA